MPIAMQYGSGKYSANPNGNNNSGGGSTGIEMKLLWTNPSTNTAFAAQTVQLDLSGYQYVGIVASGSVTFAPIFMQWLACDVSTAQYLWIYGGNGSNGYRTVTISSTGIAFSAGYYGGTNNNMCIPYKIYGIKGIT